MIKHERAVARGPSGQLLRPPPLPPARLALPHSTGQQYGAGTPLQLLYIWAAAVLHQTTVLIPDPTANHPSCAQCAVEPCAVPDSISIAPTGIAPATVSSLPNSDLPHIPRIVA